MKGFQQEYDVDFDEVFSPVWFLLDVVALTGLDLFQLDVKTAFRHGDLDEEIYME
jgi:hypothetical protein